jgi:inositol transport system substrate-binding protein
MRLKRFLSIAILFTVLLIALSGCSTEAETSSSGSNSDGNLVIGASLPDFDDKWLSYLQDGMKEYEATLENTKVIYTDAMNDAAKQLSQVENFISQQVDAIFIIPVDTVSAKIMLEKANDAGIPIIVVNREFEGVEEATAYVGSDSLEAGTIQMEAVAESLGGKGNIGIMNGIMGHDSQIQRTEGNKQIIEENPDMSVVLEGTGEYDRAKGMALMENWLNSGKEIDAIVANNDEMAIGAIMAAEADGKLDDIVIAGIDATPDALEYVKSGQLAVTVFQDAKGQGKGGLEAAYKAAKGEELEKRIMIPYELVTQENVDDYIKKWEE